MELKDNVPKIADRTIWNLAMEGTPYAHPIGGTLNSVPGLAQKDVVQFFRETYIPQQAVFLIVGKADPQRLLEESRRALEGWPPGGAGQDLPSASRQGGRKVLILDRPDLTQSEIRIALPGVARQNRRYLAFKLMNYILGGGGFSSWLMERVRSQKGYTYGIRSSFYALRIPGPLIISTFTPTETTYAAFEEIRELASDHLRLDDMRVVIVGRSEAFLKPFEGLGTIEVISYKDVSP